MAGSSNLYKFKSMEEIETLSDKLSEVAFVGIQNQTLFTKAVEKLPNLTRIGLIDCVLPRDLLASLKSVTWVEISSEASIETLMSIRDLPNLEVLRINFGRADQVLLRHIFEAIPHLRGLSFYNNSHVTNEEVLFVGSHFEHLNHLELNSLEGLSEDSLNCFYESSSLTSLDVTFDHNGTDAISQWIEKISKINSLTKLRLARCECLEMESLRRLHGLPLESLTLEDNEDGEVDDISILGEFKYLKELTLTDFYAVEYGLESISRLSHLEHLTLQYCGSLEEDQLAYLENFRGLKSLELIGFRLNDKRLLKIIAHNLDIEQLDLSSSSGLTIKSMAAVGLLSKLKSLTWHIKEFDGGFNELTSLSGLKILDLTQNTNIQAQDVDQLIKIPNLEHLEIKLIELPLMVEIPSLLKQMPQALSQYRVKKQKVDDKICEEFVDLRVKSVMESRLYEIKADKSDE